MMKDKKTSTQTQDKDKEMLTEDNVDVNHICL